MYEIPLQIKMAISRYEPLPVEGMTLYPIRVSEYGPFTVARGAIEFVIQTLPARLLSVPLLQAFFEIEMEHLEKGEEPEGLLSRAILFLILALRIGRPTEKTEERMQCASLAMDETDPKKLRAILLTDSATGRTREITPVQFERLRPILAAQNGLKLTSENANVELLKTERDLESGGKGPAILPDIEDKVAAVCLLRKESEATVMEWPILRLERQAAAAKRMMDYMICGIAEGSGASWKGGNPAPHPFYRREPGLTRAVKNLSKGQLEAVEAQGGFAMLEGKEGRTETQTPPTVPFMFPGMPHGN